MDPLAQISEDLSSLLDKFDALMLKMEANEQEGDRDLHEVVAKTNGVVTALAEFLDQSKHDHDEHKKLPADPLSTKIAHPTSSQVEASSSDKKDPGSEITMHGQAEVWTLQDIYQKQRLIVVVGLEGTIMTSDELVNGTVMVFERSDSDFIIGSRRIRFREGVRELFELLEKNYEVLVYSTLDFEFVNLVKALGVKVGLWSSKLKMLSSEGFPKDFTRILKVPENERSILFRTVIRMEAKLDDWAGRPVHLKVPLYVGLEDICLKRCHEFFEILLHTFWVFESYEDFRKSLDISREVKLVLTLMKEKRNRV
jgi:hypothetical protein